MAAGTSVLGAPLHLTGLARQAEPDPGMWVDPIVLALGTLATLAAFALLAVVMTLAVAARRSSTEPSMADGVARRLRLSAAASTGIRFALDSGRGIGGVPTRSAIVGAAFGVAGIVATLTFSASIARLLERPDDWGATFDVIVEAPEDLGGAEDLARRVGEVDGVAATAVNMYAQTDEVSSALENGDRRIAQEFETMVPMRGSIPLTVVDGRPPLRQNEIVVGERVLELLDVEIGDRVVADCGDTRVDRTIVGNRDHAWHRRARPQCVHDPRRAERPE